MTITLYSQPNCVPCRTLKYFLDKNNYSYDEKDIFENQQEVAKYTSLMHPPVVVVNDTHVITGPNIAALKEALNG